MAENDKYEIGERIARHRERIEAEPGNWPAKRQLAAALRQLLDVLTSTQAEPAELSELADRIERAAEGMRAKSPAAQLPGDPEAMVTGMENFHDRSPMIGLVNPMAPPAVLDSDVEGDLVRGTVEFGTAYEGGPGLVHGGFLASLLDEMLGMATIFSGHPGMTGELTVRYLRPTPIRVPLRFEARFDRSEGRKIFTSGELYLGDEPCVTARGLFVSVQYKKFAEFHEERVRRHSD